MTFIIYGLLFFGDVALGWFLKGVYGVKAEAVVKTIGGPNPQ